MIVNSGASKKSSTDLEKITVYVADLADPTKYTIIKGTVDTTNHTIKN